MELLANPTFYVAIALLLLLAFAGKPAWRFTRNALDSRGDRIRTELEEAVRLREEAQAMLAEYQRRQRDYMKDAEAIVAHTKSDAEAMVKRAEQDLKDTLERRKLMALQKIEQSEVAALNAVRQHVVDVATDAARHIVIKQTDAKTRASLIESSLNQLSTKLH